ncbi:MAG TPA: nucleotidyltransferase family protein [Nitrospinota bacterium]|nr:nucleotidyltransferase family protein [Nitrospinota bacterium]
MAWTQENNLLLLCSQVNLDNNAKQRIKEFNLKNLNWEYLINRSLTEGLFGFLYKSLKNSQIETPPQKEFKELERMYYQNLAKNMVILKELDSLLKYLNESHIPIILLRGSTFLKTIYSDIGLRYFDDIDIFIKHDHYEKICKILKKNDFFPLPFYPDRYLKDSINLDIHTSLFNVSRIRSRGYAVKINDEEIWKDARSIENHYPNVLCLSPYDNILTLSLHSLKHSYAQLIWFVDMNEIINQNKDNLNWDKLLQRAELFNLTRPLYYSLLYLKKKMNSPIPDFVFNKNMKWSYLEKRTLNFLLKNEKIERYGELLFIYGIPKKSHKLKYLFELLFPRPAVLSQVFGFYRLSSIPLLYILRLFQMAFLIPKESLRFLCKVLIPRKK